MAGLIQRGVIRIAAMTQRILDPNRREVLAAIGTSLGASLGVSLGASAAGLIAGGAGPLPTAQALLQARPAALALRPGQKATPIWELAAVSPIGSVRFKRGDRCQVVFRNDLPVPIAPAWYGLDGIAVPDPLAGRTPTAPGSTETSIISIPNAGTLLANFRLFEDSLKQPARPLPIIAAETSPLAVDRDEVLLIEEWRLRADGAALAPGQDPRDTIPLYTLNGRTSFELSAAAGERLRLRFINGSQRSVLAIKLESHEVQVMALDGQPAEPFPARNGALVLAPGARADAIVDAARPAAFMLHDGKEARPIGRLAVSGKLERDAPLAAPQPLPSNGLPEKLDLKPALRFDVALNASDAGWARTFDFSTASAPAFRAKAGRTVVLAVRNPAPITTVFHLHGHPFRLLDRLDDGWKPYWLDTLALEPGKTERIAFAATSPGRWLIESVVTDWAAPRLLRWYGVE